MCVLLASSHAASFAQGKPDDSYKGPPPTGGFNGQLGIKQPPAPGAPAAAAPAQSVPGASATPGGGLRGRQTEGSIAPIPIAIPLFLGDDPQVAADVANVVQADLERSGLFQPLDRASFLEQIHDVNAAPRFPDWRTIRTDALVVGRISKGADGKVGAEFRLWDVTSGKQLAGQRFSTASQNWRRVGHLIADQVYHRAAIIGAPCLAWRSLDLAAIIGRITINGVMRAEGLGAELLGNPMNALAWLADSATAHGFGGLRAGQVMMLGSVTPPIWLDGPGPVSVAFAGLGEAVLHLG